MAMYPAFGCTTESTATPESGLDAARATNGALKVRAMYPDDKMTFEVHHVLTPAQRTQLETFYGTNRLLDVAFRWPGDGQTYTVRFASRPQYTRLWQHYRARVRLLEV